MLGSRVVVERVPVMGVADPSQHAQGTFGQRIPCLALWVFQYALPLLAHL